MPSNGPSAPPGWYADPWGHHSHRYFDGQIWTGHTGDGPPSTRSEASLQPQPAGIGDDFLSAERLARSLREGWTPPPITVDIPLSEDEQAIAQSTAQTWIFTETNVNSSSPWLVGFGSPLLLLSTVGGSIAYNKWQNQKAAQQAAAQWRFRDSGELLVTTKKLAFMGTKGWTEVSYATLRHIDVDGEGVILFAPNAVRTRISLWHPLTHAVLLRFLAFGSIPQAPEEAASPPSPGSVPPGLASGGAEF